MGVNDTTLPASEAAPPSERPRPSYVLTRWIFLRLLGFVYFCAFASLWPQVRGLIGSHGILPAADFLRDLHAGAGPQSFGLAPSLFWLNSSDAALSLLCGAGVVLALLLIAGVLPPVMLALLWLCYLSLVNVGQDFLSFQWDVLLLEAGFLAIFFAPGQVWPRFRAETPPSMIALWLLRWLLFRLMLMSGVVKLASGDPTWHNLTALTYHYETQPLPTPLAWYAFHLPFWFQRLSTGLVFVIELVAPFGIFGPRPVRLICAALLAGLQVLILLTGNYAFFNLLTIALCITLLDDVVLRRLLPRSLRERFAEPVRRPAPPARRRWIVGPAAVVLVTMSLLQLGSRVGIPPPAQSLLTWQEPLHLVNTYGLFAVMTTTRPEIVVEGSDDGMTWRAYGWRFQPQNPQRAPRWAAPYQPRLDWQLWFAALGSADTTPWFRNFLLRLLQGSPDVLGLLATNPFPNHPPRQVRAVLYDYRFTDSATHRVTGAWWQRRAEGLYFPLVSLRGG